jgi:hypothetical protein
MSVFIAPVMADKPEWAGKGKPSAEQKAAHKVAMEAKEDKKDKEDKEDKIKDKKDKKDKSKS